MTMQDMRGQGPPGDIGTFQMPCSVMVFQHVFSGTTYVCAIRSGGRAWVLVDYGTVASTVIQAAIAALTVGRTWQETIVLKGNFITTVIIQLSSYARILLYGKITLANTSPAGTSIFENSDTVGGNSNIEICGGVLDGNQVNQAAGLHAHIIRLVKVTDSYIHDLTTVNSSYDHIILDGGCKNILIDHWVGDSGRDDGFNPLIASEITIVNSVARNITADGFHLSNGSSYITVDKCVSYNNGDNGIGIYNSIHDTISNNLIISNPEGIGFLSGDCSYTKIIGNRIITTTVGHGINLNDGAATTSFSQIINNTIKGATTYGILVQSSSAASYVSIVGNTIYGGTRGIQVQALYCLVDNNEIYNPADYGILLIGGSNYHVIQGNLVDIAGNSGVYVDGTHNVISNNILKNIGDKSIKEVGTADYNNIFGNDVVAAMTIIGAHTKVHHNIGFVTENTVLSATFAIDATGIKTVTTAHGLAVTPALEDVSLTLVENTAVDDWVCGFLKLVSVGAVNVVAKVNVTVASVTAASTAKLSIRVGKA